MPVPWSHDPHSPGSAIPGHLWLIIHAATSLLLTARSGIATNHPNEVYKCSDSFCVDRPIHHHSRRLLLYLYCIFCTECLYRLLKPAARHAIMLQQKTGLFVCPNCLFPDQLRHGPICLLQYPGHARLQGNVWHLRRSHRHVRPRYRLPLPLNSINYVGFVFGLVTGNLLSRKFGRRKALFIMCFWAILAAIILITSRHRVQIVVGRTVAYVYIGMELALVPVLQSELVPAEVRGLVVGTYQSGLLVSVIILQARSTTNLPSSVNFSWLSFAEERVSSRGTDLGAFLWAVLCYPIHSRSRHMVDS